MTEPTEDPKPDTIEDLQSQIDTLEAMLAHASATIGRLEGRWRAPGAAEVGQRALVVATNPLRQVVAIRILNGVWLGMEPNTSTVDILAWCELPPIPADESYKDLV